MSTSFTVTLEESGAQFSCPDGECVLSAMEHQGLKHIPVGCRGGGCGTGRVFVMSGRYRTRKMSRAQVSESEQQAGYALACRLIPKGNLVLRLAGDGSGV